MKVAILGTGLIGGSVGLALKRAGDHEVVAFDRDPQAAGQAVARGAADASMPDPASAVAGAELIFICTPVSAIAEVVAEAVPGLRPGVLVTDVGSTKAKVVLEVEGLLPADAVFVGGHPMAGSEDEGVAAATADLFDGAWWILTPTERSGADDYARLHGVLTTLGARVMALSPSEHDELLAVVSHLPQLTATTLMNLAAERGEGRGSLLALAAGGFRDVTRIAASNPEIWVDICAENSSALVEALDAFSDRLADLREAIRAGDRAALMETFTAARTARRALPGKQLAGVPYEIRMPVPDRPGVLAEVTTAVGALGINIEDLEISHSAEGGRGTLHLTVSGDAPAQRVIETLRAHGFDPRSS